MPTARAMSSIWASRTPRSSKSRRVAEMISASRSRRAGRGAAAAAVVSCVGSVLMAVSLGRRALGRADRCGVDAAHGRSRTPSPASLVAALLGALLVPLAPCRRRRPRHRFAGTARLPGCSGAVVRWASALDSDPAVVITNGHCVRFPFLGARETLVDVRAVEEDRAARRCAATSRRPSAARGWRTPRCIAPTSRSTSCASRTPTSRRPASPRSPSPRAGRRGATGSDPVRLLGRAACLHDHRDGVPAPRARLGLAALDPAARPRRLRASAAATPARRSSPATTGEVVGHREHRLRRRSPVHRLGVRGEQARPGRHAAGT